MNKDLANLVAKALYDAWKIGIVYQYSITPEDKYCFKYWRA